MAKRKASSGYGILMILSPAKTLDLSPMKRSSLAWTIPDLDTDKTKEIANIIKRKKGNQLSKLLNISTKLASTAYQHWSSFTDNPTDRENLKPSIFSFSGAAYQGLDISTCSDNDVQYMQQNLRIIDPLYGILRPLDLLQPYRLEMACKEVFPHDRKLKLADYWKTAVSEKLSEELNVRSDKVLLNLASDEYSAAVDSESLPTGTKFVKVIFWQEGRTIAIHAKRARGLMVRFLSQNQVDNIDSVKEFAEEGYSFREDESNDLTFVFDRQKPDSGTSQKKDTKTEETKADQRSTGRKRRRR